MARRNWQRDELLLALNLYCRLPFGKYHGGNAEIIQLAAFIDRTPDAVAMKLSNFASLDPSHQARGIKGLQNTSRADREIWREFNTNWESLAVESEEAYSKISGQVLNEESHFSEHYEGQLAVYAGATEIEREVKVRLGQQFFRKMILTSYAARCCVCGMPIPEFLIASHIIPWRDNTKLRVNPHNGLCLCALHDKGFDRGFFTLGEDYEIVIGKKLREYIPNSTVEYGFTSYEGNTITLPDKFVPEQAYLAIHRTNYFQG